MQPFTAQAATPAEDLDDVLGRFHNWTKAHKESRKHNEMTQNELIDGVRELSYEEALESTRRRWQSHKQSRPSPGYEEPAKDNHLSENSVLPDKVTLSTPVTERQANLSAAGKTLPVSFRDALTETVTPVVSSGPLALVWPAAGRTERQVSMSLRVAASEQALIKARAAEAGLSVSAYLRHCALEVEKLRNQVHHTLAIIEQRSEQNPVRSLASGSPPPPPPRGFFARVRERIFGTAPRLTISA